MNKYINITTKLSTLVVLILLAGCSNENDQSKADKIVTLMKTSGVYDYLESTYQDNKKIFNGLRESSQREIKSQYPELPADFWKEEEKAYAQLQGALKKYDVSTDEYVRKWAEFYGEQLTIQDIETILEYYSSNVGRKELAAQAQASYKWNDYIANGYQETLENAFKEYNSQIAIKAKSYSLEQ